MQEVFIRRHQNALSLSLRAAGKEVFRSWFLREGMAGVPVSADLGGTREFVVEVHDAGDGIACDQADWAEARVALTDGSVVSLGDIAMNDRHPPLTTLSCHSPSVMPASPQLAACSSHQFGEMIHANEENQKLFIDRYLEKGLKLDYWWMDAGWYVSETGWPNTGT